MFLSREDQERYPRARIPPTMIIGPVHDFVKFGGRSSLLARTL
jgi:hypothetical protein